MGKTTAYREFCYRWTCQQCGTMNRRDDLHPGSTSSCVSCDNDVVIDEIVYDNGAVMRMSASVPYVHVVRTQCSQIERKEPPQ